MLWRDSDGQGCYTGTPKFFCIMCEPCTFHTSLYTKMHLLIFQQNTFLETTSHLHLTGIDWKKGVLCPLCAMKNLESKLYFAGCLGANLCKIVVKCSEEITKHTLVWNSDCLTPNQAVKDLCCLQNICSISHYRTEGPQQESIVRFLQKWHCSCFQN